jgi:hypothetical protein
MYDVTCGSINIIRVITLRRMRWEGHVVRMGDMRYAYSILFGKPEGKRQLQRLRRRWKDNIRLDFREIWREDVVWIRLA